MGQKYQVFEMDAFLKLNTSTTTIDMHLFFWYTFKEVLKNICLKGIEFSSIFREVINMQNWAKKRPIFFLVNNNFSNVRIFGDNSLIFWDFFIKCLENSIKPS